MPTNDLDVLMARLEEINSQTPPLSAKDIDDLIAIHRHARAIKAAGIKPSRTKVDISAILGRLTQSASKTEPTLKPFVLKPQVPKS